MEKFIVCPFCKKNLDTTKNGVRCLQCNKDFLIKKGVLCFGATDDFYEGKFTVTKNWVPEGRNKLTALLKRINRRLNISGYESRFLEKNIAKCTSFFKPNNLILDFGCGGGVKTLASYGRTIGVDLSVGSLLKSKNLYQNVFQINGINLPFADNTFSVVYNSHVFGHIPVNEKPKVISEMFRILRPGGFMVSSIECDSESIVYRRAKKYPELFRQCYVEPWGHYGLELPCDNFDRFQKAGFLPVTEIADIHKGYLRPAASYTLLLAYKGKDRLLYSLGVFSDFVSKSSKAVFLLDLLFGLMLPLAYLFTPPNHRDSAKVVYQKPL